MNCRISRLCRPAAWTYTSTARVSYFPKLVQNRNLPPHLCVIDDKTAETIGHRLAAGDKNVPIIEASPGSGLLTRKLLELGVKKVHAMEFLNENDTMTGGLGPTYHKNLLSLQRDFRQLSIHQLPSGVEDNSPQLELTYLRAVSDYMPLQFPSENFEWESPIPPFKCFLPIHHKQNVAVLHQLCNFLCQVYGLFSFGRCEVFMILSADAKDRYIENKKYKYQRRDPLNILLPSFFDFEIVEELVAAGFFPRNKLNSRSKNVNVYLVKYTPKASLTKDLPIENWSEFNFFVKQVNVAQTSYVIPYLEKWIPNSGPRLLKIGIPLYTQFIKLSPKDFIAIFREVITWPEYPSSAFKMVASSGVVDEAVESIN